MSIFVSRLAKFLHYFFCLSEPGLWSRSRESDFKTAGVRVGFIKLVESELVVGVGFSKLLESESESEHLLQLPTPMFIK